MRITVGELSFDDIKKIDKDTFLVNIYKKDLLFIMMIKDKKTTFFKDIKDHNDYQKELQTIKEYVYRVLGYQQAQSKLKIKVNYDVAKNTKDGDVVIEKKEVITHG